MKRSGYLFLLVMIVLSGCSIFDPAQTVIDWVDFIKIDGITYESIYSGLGRELTEDDLDREYSRIKFNVSKNVFKTGYKIKDGDAAYLDKDTVIYSLKGYDPTFRLAAKRENRLILFEAYQNPEAKTGADYLDIKDKVESIGINSDQDGVTELARIKNAKAVERLVDILLSSKIETSSIHREGERCLLVFYLNDGTTVERMFWYDINLLQSDIRVTDEFAAMIKTAMGDEDISRNIDS